VPGLVNIQFMVKLYGDQSAPITPESAAIASFGRLIGPYTISSAPGSVLNRHGRWKVRMPWPKLADRRSGGAWVRLDRDRIDALPSPRGEYRLMAVDDMGDELHVVPGFRGRRGTPP
jgi:hypothetical protein